MNAIKQLCPFLSRLGLETLPDRHLRLEMLRLWLLKAIGKGNQVLDLLGNRTLRSTTSGALAFHTDLIVPYFHDILLKPGINILQLLQRQSVNANLFLLSQSHTSTTEEQNLG